MKKKSKRNHAPVEFAARSAVLTDTTHRCQRSSGGVHQDKRRSKKAAQKERQSWYD